MKKTLHIMPSGALWNRIALWWIGKELDKHDILQYPVRTNVHYLPENFSEVEMMKVAISWGDAELYEDLKVFSKKLSEIQNYDKVVVWHAEDADSRLLFCTISTLLLMTGALDWCRQKKMSLRQSGMWMYFMWGMRAVISQDPAIP